MIDPISPAYLLPLLGNAAKSWASGAASAKLKKLLETPPVKDAWDAACNDVVAEYPNLMTKYTGSALSNAPDPEEKETLEGSVKSFFKQAGFPTRYELKKLLLAAWIERKESLPEAERAAFFRLKEVEAAPVLGMLATRFFVRLAQKNEFFQPAVIDILQSMLEQQGQHRQLSEEEAKIALVGLKKAFKSTVEKTYRTIAVSAEKIFPITYSAKNGEKGKAGNGLLADAKEFKLVLLTGAAGSGKSSLLVNAAHELAVDGAPYLPLYLDVTQLKESFTQLRAPAATADDSNKRWEHLVQALSPDVSVEVLDALTEHLSPFFLVDKLNEVSGPEVAYNILQALHGYKKRRALKDTLVIAAGRQVPEELSERWTMLAVDRLPEQVVKQQIGTPQYNNLSKAARDLLSTPYYLQLALDSGNPDTGTAARTIETFFEKRVKMSPDELDKAAGAAFHMYKITGNTKFQKGAFIQKAGQEVWNKLDGASVVQSFDDDMTSFQHQLYHDYLAARHSANQKLWDPISLDVISLKANSFSAISMVLEQLKKTEAGDEFLRSVYDWNVTAAMDSLRAGETLTPRRYSDELHMALLAVISEKLFDNVTPTRNKAKTQFERFYSELGAKKIGHATNLSDVVREVETLGTSVPWFSVWKALFKLQKGASETDVTQINSKDPIMGWTAANVVKRESGQPDNARQLREIYRSHEAAVSDSNPLVQETAETGASLEQDVPYVHSDTIRWRVVHALGAFADDGTVTLLLQALEKDRYHWARYGAARSLVEIAARTDNEKIRSRIISNLAGRIATLSRGDYNSRRIVDEIERTVQYKDAAGDWKQAAQTLLDAIKKARATDEPGPDGKKSI